MDMKLDISKDPSAVHPHPRGPHFWQTHDQHLRETRDGEEAYELPLQRIVDYLAAEPDDEALKEAMGLVFGNCGLIINWGALDAGERAIGKLFSQPRDEQGINRGEAFDGKGKPFVQLLLYHVAVLVEVYAGKTDAFGMAVWAHLLRFLKESGLEPNVDRIKAEFCADCRKAVETQHQSIG